MKKTQSLETRLTRVHSTCSRAVEFFCTTIMIMHRCLFIQPNNTISYYTLPVLAHRTKHFGIRLKPLRSMYKLMSRKLIAPRDI